MSAIQEPIWLRAASREAAEQALPLLCIPDTQEPDHNIGARQLDFGHLGYFDIIDAIEAAPAVFDEAGDLVTPAVPVPGWHANFYPGDPALPAAVALAEAVAASGLAIARPAHPVRVPAGYVLPDNIGEGEG